MDRIRKQSGREFGSYCSTNKQEGLRFHGKSCALVFFGTIVTWHFRICARVLSTSFAFSAAASKLIAFNTFLATQAHKRTTRQLQSLLLSTQPQYQPLARSVTTAYRTFKLAEDLIFQKTKEHASMIGKDTGIHRVSLLWKWPYLQNYNHRTQSTSV